MTTCFVSRFLAGNVESHRALLEAGEVGHLRRAILGGLADALIERAGEEPPQADRSQGDDAEDHDQ
jgi:hypothetical protein